MIYISKYRDQYKAWRRIGDGSAQGWTLLHSDATLDAVLQVAQEQYPDLTITYAENLIGATQ